ncbi:TOG array regulator of axonemal microtubules protein 1 [Lingula anatina]|uniref:TOG array regulator of axonemal microtubules protein 1 n=1 Tax=Lingula anatina TaxID=7574 RepID=A0A1S3K0D0_LINAN|nr:TOG array regulator of axonemal microtubules protein 1 [Lingula anatina]|eukprot:XP_013416093.1 TOG array regulator of axonemal microtubules protein 1 [Lingula anatina]
MAGTVAKFPSPAYNVNDDHYITHPSGISIMEQDVVLDQLYDQSFQKRADILDQLRQTARRHGGRLPFQDQLSIFQGLSRAVSDTNWDVRHQCINLINELIPKLDDNLDKCMTVVLPKLIPNLGDSKITIRKAVIQTVHVYMKYTSNIQQVFHALVQFGLENEDFKVKRETTVALPMLFTKEFENENLLEITQALAKQLVATSQSVEDNLTQVSLMSLEKIRTLVGDNVFDAYIQRLPVPVRRYYCKLTNRKEENGFDSRTSSTDLNSSLNGTPRRFTVSTQSNVASPRPSGPSTPLQEQNPIVHTPTYQQQSSHIVEMGIIPSHLMERLNNQEDFRARQAAIEELKIIIGGLQDVDLIIPHMMPLVGLLNNMLDDKNFRISVTTMDILDMLVVKLGSSVRPFSKPILNAVCKCLNDNKIVVRQSVHKVARHLMTSLSPKFVLSVICEQLGNRSARIRQEALNIIIAALLTFPSYDFDLPSLCQTIGPTLVDSKRHVRQASLECFGMLAQAMGAGRLQPLVQAVDSVELSYEGDGVMAAVQARLARRQLPRINSEGLVEYATTLSSSSQKSSASISASQGADIDWIMQAAGGGGGSARSARSDTMELESVAGSARSTPAPALESPGSTGPSPRRFLSAGRDKKKLPWAEDDDSIGREENGGYHSSNTPASQARPPKPLTESTPPPFKPRTTWGEESLGAHTENQPPPRKPYRRQTSGGSGVPIRDQSPDTGGKSASSYKQIYLRNKLKSNRDNDSGTEKGGPMSSATSSPARSRGSSGPVAESYPDDTAMFNKPYFPSSSFGGKDVKDLSSSWPDGKRLDFETKPNKPILDPISAPETPNFPDWPEHNHPLESLPRDHYTQDSRRDVDPLESPIPLKPTLARGSASKRHKVPPLSDRGSARREDDEKDSGRDSLENTLDGAPNSEELNTSLRSIRTSAKRKVEKLFEKLDRQEQNQFGTDPGQENSNSPSPDYLLESGVFSPLSTLSPRDEASEVSDKGSRRTSNKKSDSPFETKPRIARMNSMKEKKKSQENLLDNNNRMEKESPHLDYNPNSGVTFKENPNSDVKVIGRGYAEDATPGDLRASQIHSKAREKRRLAKGPVLSPLGMASMYSHGAADPEEEKAANGIGVVGKGMFDHSPAESGSDLSLNSSVHRDKRRESKQEPASPDLPVYGVGMRQNSNEKQYEEGLVESDDESVISMSKTTKERLEQKREERIKEAEEKKARKEHERRVREEHERREREERLREQKEREERQREQEREQQRIQEERQQRIMEEKQKRREEEKQREKERQQEKLKKLATEEKLNLEDLSILGNNAGTPNKLVTTKPPAATPPRRKSKSPPTLSNTFPMSKERKVSSAADHSPPSTLSSSMRPMSEAAELKRCSNPEAAVKDAQAKLAQDGWNEKCDGLSLIRRLAKHHPAVLAANLHPVNVAVMAEVRNLRSQVSRLAITTLGEMFLNLKKNMDADLENTTKVLLHKNGESNGFIREDCEKALANMIAEVTPQRALVAIIQGGGQHKNATVRRITSQLLVGLVERMGPGRILSGVKDTTDRVLPLLAQFATDGSPETRYNARKILYMLMSHQDFDKCLTKYLPQNTLRNIQEVVDNVRQKGPGDDPSDTPTARSRRSGQGSRSRGNSAGSSMVDGSQGSPSLPSSSSSKKRGHRVHMDEQTQEEIKEMNNMLGASDWKQRHEGLTRLTEMCEQNPEVVGANITKIFDKFVSRLNDSNSKVNLFALQVLLQITPLLKDYMGSCINMVIQTVSNNLSSKNKDIYSTAMDILDCFMEHLDEAILLQPFANQAQAGNVRVKPDMIEKVAYLVTKVYPRKQKPVMLHVLPLLWHLLGAQASSGSVQGGTGNTQTATARLVSSLYQQMGQSLLDQASSHLAPRHMQTLQDMIQNQQQ